MQRKVLVLYQRCQATDSSGAHCGSVYSSFEVQSPAMLRNCRRNLRLFCDAIMYDERRGEPLGRWVDVCVVAQKSNESPRQTYSKRRYRFCGSDNDLTIARHITCVGPTKRRPLHALLRKDKSRISG
jgi:hypothetical protein